MKLRLTGLVALIVTTLFTSALVATPAQAADEGDAHIQSVSTQWLTSNRDLSVTILLRSSEAHDVVDVHTSYSKSPLIGRSQVGDVLKNRALPALTRISTTTFTNVDAGDQQLSLTLTREQFKINKRGAYVFHFEVQYGDNTTPLNLLMPYVSLAGFTQPLQLVTLWSVASEPTITSSGETVDENAAQQFDAGNPLDAIVSAGNQRVTWLTDPDIVTTADSLGAVGWKEALLSQSSASERFTLPTANADIATLLEANQKDAVALATQPINDAPLIYIPRTGDLKAQTWKSLAERNATVVVSDRCYPSSTSTYTTNGIYKNANIKQTALVADSQMSDLMTVAISHHSDAVAYQQALLSDSLITQLERPNTQRVVVLNPRTANVHVDAVNAKAALSVVNAPWTSAMSVAKAVTFHSGSRTHTGCATRYMVKSTLSQVMDSNRARRKLRALIANTSEEQTLLTSILRTSSMNLRKTRLRAMTQDLSSFTEKLLGSVKIMSAGAVILPAEQGKVPITINNSLSVPATITITAVGEPAVRVIPQEVMEIQIGAGKRKSIEIPVRLIGSDVGFVNLQLKDSSGRAVGAPVRIQLSSSAYAAVARWVMGFAGVLLLLLLLRRGNWRIRRLLTASRKNDVHE